MVVLALPDPLYILSPKLIEIYLPFRQAYASKPIKPAAAMSNVDGSGTGALRRNALS